MSSVNKDTAPSSQDGKHKVDPVRWVNDYGDFLYNFAVMHLRDKTLAEEMVQDTFVSALGSADKFRGLATERSWLTAILKHKIIDYIRKISRERKYFQDVERGTEDKNNFNDIGHWKVEPEAWPENPAQAFEKKAFFERLNDCIEKLPEQQASVFIMREFGELSTDEICKAIDVSTTNLWVLLHRARMKLRRCLEVNWFGINRG